ncbi:Phosphatidylserine decarboxylase proenzyme [Oopsacas minuta]|uniref:phosphatidylserine decarboxylase n=1 Tax=Oopsacas minuta TaxID=111878 RepID=A0AAV7JZ42_9METZ|nr:Phosphatidylserine decarboxylase proenzyme [Oopsacas minuta]
MARVMFRHFSIANIHTLTTKRYRLRNVLALSALLGVGSYYWMLYFGRNKTSMNKHEVYEMVRVVPTRFLSRLWGRFTNTTFSSHFISIYAKIFKCDLRESLVSDIAKFSTLSDFFSRELKPNSRPICSDHPLAAPCDGKVLNFGIVSADLTIEQIKGRKYSVASLLGCEVPHSNQDRVFYFMTLYLSPGDYHHFHSPADWRAKHAIHFPRDLLPVSPWILKWVSNIFSKNERVALTGEWQWGFFSFVAVGAYNVGNIQITFLPEIHTNTQDLNTKEYKLDNVIQIGQEVGEFKLGSTIVLVFEAPKDFAFIVTPSTSVKCGEPIGVLMSEFNMTT